MQTYDETSSSITITYTNEVNGFLKTSRINSIISYALDIMIENFTENTVLTLGYIDDEKFRPYRKMQFPVVCSANDSIQGFGLCSINADGKVTLVLNISGAITLVTGGITYLGLQ